MIQPSGIRKAQQSSFLRLTLAGCTAFRTMPRYFTVFMLSVLTMALTAPMLGEAKKCTVDGKEGVIGYETHRIPNFNGELVSIVVEHCKVGTTYYLTGYKTAAMVTPSLDGALGSQCSRAMCGISVEGMAILRTMREQKLAACV